MLPTAAADQRRQSVCIACMNPRHPVGAEDKHDDNDNLEWQGESNAKRTRSAEKEEL